MARSTQRSSAIRSATAAAVERFVFARGDARDDRGVRDDEILVAEHPPAGVDDPAERTRADGMEEALRLGEHVLLASSPQNRAEAPRDA